MIEVADNANNAGPGRGQSEAGASSGARRAFTGKRVVLGIGLLVLAVLLWSSRDTVPTWLAKICRMLTSAFWLSTRIETRMSSSESLAGSGLSLSDEGIKTPASPHTVAAIGKRLQTRSKNLKAFMT